MKIGWKIAFFTVWSGGKTSETENEEENNPFGPTHFYPPNLGGKWGGSDADDVICTNTLTLLQSPTPLTFPLLYNIDIIVNLYKLYFLSSHFSLQPNKNVLYPPTNYQVLFTQNFACSMK